MNSIIFFLLIVYFDYYCFYYYFLEMPFVEKSDDAHTLEYRVIVYINTDRVECRIVEFRTILLCRGSTQTRNRVRSKFSGVFRSYYVNTPPK